jgi:predicted CXXCH cytochrome family protein
MAHAGVTCSDCHDPHSATLRAQGNALCTRCHTPARYDAPAHHHHQPAGAGAACVDCHMPARTYMQIDARRDHSLRVPRPNLTVATGAPNACTSCHTTRSPEWATAALRTWLGRDPVGFQDFATVFHDADLRRPGAVRALASLAAAAAEPPIVRASAFDRLADAGVPAADVASGLHDPDGLVRRSALHALEQASPIERIPLILPLLNDPRRSVRIAAARLIAPVASQLDGTDKANFDRASADLVASARFNADRPESRVAVGVFFADQSRAREAADEYQAAIRLGPDFAPGYINLAELLRTTTSETEAERVLRDGLARNPSSAELHYALGLSLTRAHRLGDAVAELKRASDLSPETARFTYGYALALNQNGQATAAIRLLTTALATHPDDRDILFALAAFERDAGQLDAARQHAARLIDTYPADTEGRALVESLRGGRR